RERAVDVWGTSRGRERDGALGIAGVGRAQCVTVRLLLADEHRHPDRELAFELVHPREQRLARLALSQLEHGLVREAARRVCVHGAARSSSSGRPLACSSAKLSFEVFSSTRRTRYAIPATTSPTGQ